VGAAGAVGAGQDAASGRGAGAVAGQPGQRVTDHRDVVGGGVGPGVARPQQHRKRFTGAVGAVVDERDSGWNPKPRVNDGAASSLSECEPTKVASTSITSGRAASASWSGACSRQGSHPGPSRGADSGTG